MLYLSLLIFLISFNSVFPLVPAENSNIEPIDIYSLNVDSVKKTVKKLLIVSLILEKIITFSLT